MTIPMSKNCFRNEDFIQDKIRVLFGVPPTEYIDNLELGCLFYSKLIYKNKLVSKRIEISMFKLTNKVKIEVFDTSDNDLDNIIYLKEFDFDMSSSTIAYIACIF